MMVQYDTASSDKIKNCFAKKISRLRVRWAAVVRHHSTQVWDGVLIMRSRSLASSKLKFFPLIGLLLRSKDERCVLKCY